jgi:alpha-L-fucosidase
MIPVAVIKRIAIIPIESSLDAASNGVYNISIAHVLEPQTGGVCLQGLAGKIEKMRLLADGSEVKNAEYWNLTEYPEDAFFFLSPLSFDSYPLPDPVDTVVEITLKD